MLSPELIEIAATLDTQTVHCMSDLETMGQTNRSAIMAVAGVVFTEATDLDSVDSNGYPTKAPYFYQLVDLQSSVDLGLEMDPQTVLFWMAQEGAAKAELLKKHASPISEVLGNFASFYRSCDCKQLWGNGLDFDNSIMEFAYRQLAQRTQRENRATWTFRDGRCFRTAKNFFPSILKVENQVKHHALHDALHQARAAQRALKAIRVTNYLLEQGLV